MNYLAHFHLAAVVARQGGYDDEALLVGALLGDYIKGPLRGDWPAEWEVGIRLHRRIDALTDGHPLVSECLAGFPSEFRRYGGIALDVCFDHFLLDRWSDHALDNAPTAAQFAGECYRVLGAKREHFPVAAQRQLAFLTEHNVLCILRDWTMAAQMLARISRRLKRQNPLGDCAAVLDAQRPAIARCFDQLYPRLLEQLPQEFAH